MSSSTDKTVQSIRSHYNQQAKSEQDKKEVLGYYFFRPISFYPTAWFLRLGVSANQTTWISIAFLVLGCLVLASGYYLAAVIGAVMINIWIVLDFVDGNIARFHNQSSKYGEFLDALGASIAHFVYFAAGVGAYFNERLQSELYVASVLFDIDPCVPILLGAWGSLTAIWIRLVYQKFINTFQGDKFERYDVVDAGKPASFIGKVMTVANNIVDLSGFLLPLLLVSVIFRGLDLFLIFFAFANTMILIISFRQIVHRGAVACE